MPVTEEKSLQQVIYDEEQEQIRKDEEERLKQLAIESQPSVIEQEDYVTADELLQVIEQRDSALAEVESTKLAYGILIFIIITISVAVIAALLLYVRHIKRNLARVPPSNFKVQELNQVQANTSVRTGEALNDS